MKKIRKVEGFNAAFLKEDVKGTAVWRTGERIGDVSARLKAEKGLAQVDFDFSSDRRRGGLGGLIDRVRGIDSRIEFTGTRRIR